MSHKWIPEKATHYALQGGGGYSSHMTVHFLEKEDFAGMDNSGPLEIKPISELSKDLAIADVCKQIKDKPLADRMAPTADQILQRGADHIRDRAATRDQPNGERTMGQTVKAFNAIFGTKLTEEQGWQFMSILKIVRSANGKVNIDDYEDQAAYAALAAEAAMSERV